MRWIGVVILLIIVVLLELYAFQALKTVSKSKIIRYSWFFVSLAAYLNFLYVALTYDRTQGQTPQFQMQSGVTGTNIIRVYNPVKQSQEKDKDGQFIRKWLPELSELPDEIIHTPWDLSPMEQQLYQCDLGECYPLPIIDIKETGKIARDILWGFRQRFDTKKEGQRIIKKHVRETKKPSKPRKAKQLKNKVN